MKTETDRGWNRPGKHSSDYGLSKDHNHDRRSYAGMGPRGYKRNDLSIKEEASEILFQCLDLDASGLELDVTDGCVYLKGHVDGRDQKKLAERLVENVSGVLDVQNELAIKRSDLYK